MRTKRRKRAATSAAADLTPMIDVVFQLLIFFILCTRFRDTERSFEVQLPKDQGPNTNHTIPKEALTVYCQWDEELGGNSYTLAIDARGRMPVAGSFATLSELVIFGSDGNATVAQKRARYTAMHNNLVSAMESYIQRSGADIASIEIAFAKDPVAGARSGTAPWLFVASAIDAAAKLNKARQAAGQDELPVNFKFSDSLRRYD
jgi:biopolymer transport protein ExbD